MSVTNMNEVPEYRMRHPLGLPAGSVRAILTLLVLGLIWGMLLLPTEKDIKVPLYLYYLMFLILGHYFAAHGHSIAGPSTGPASPLHMPAGSIRFVIVFGFVLVLAYRYYKYRSFHELVSLDQPVLEQAYLPLALAGSFFLGVTTASFVRRWRAGRGPSPLFQDLQAWIALLATMGLSIEFVIHLAINPSMEPENRLHLHEWQTMLACVTSYYFGARS